MTPDPVLCSECGKPIQDPPECCGDLLCDMCWDALSEGTPPEDQIDEAEYRSGKDR